MPSKRPSEGRILKSIRDDFHKDPASRKTSVLERTLIEKTIFGPAGVSSKKSIVVGPERLRDYAQGESEYPTQPRDSGRTEIGRWSRFVAAVKRYGFGDK
jgi:hypothetical protein